MLTLRLRSRSPAGGGGYQHIFVFFFWVWQKLSVLHFFSAFVFCFAFFEGPHCIPSPRALNLHRGSHSFAQEPNADFEFVPAEKCFYLRAARAIPPGQEVVLPANNLDNPPGASSSPRCPLQYLGAGMGIFETSHQEERAKKVKKY